MAGHEDRLIPVPVVDLNDGGQWRSQVAEWAERGVRAVRIAPAFYHNRVDGEAAEGLAQEAVSRGWPVVVALNAVRGVPWVNGRPGDALQLAQRFPQLRILLLGANRSQWYETIDILGMLPMYTWNCQPGDWSGTGTASARGFGNRLLSGSNYGMSYPNVCMERIRCSSVDEQVKHAVLSGNAATMLGRPRPHRLSNARTEEGACYGTFCDGSYSMIPTLLRLDSDVRHYRCHQETG